MTTIKYTGTEPHRATPGAAGYDLTATEPTTLLPGQTKTIPTGLHLELPENTALLVLPRSGLAAKHGITVANAPGLIDPDYRGEIKVILINHGDTKYTIKKGDRIAQALFTPFVAPKFSKTQTLTPTLRGAGGLGSTGVAA